MLKYTEMETADYWIKHLNLKPHPEGGFYSEVFRSSINISSNELPYGYTGDRRVATSIYFMLRSEDISKMHRLKSDELWYFHSGASVRIYIIDHEGKKHVKFLGPKPENGESFCVRIPAGNIFAAEVTKANTHSLMSCVVAPGFDFDDFEMFEKDDLIQAYPKHTELFERFC